MFTQDTNALHTWANKHARVLFPVFVLMACLLALWLRTLHLDATPGRSPDERLYTSFALQVARDGLGAYQGIFANYVTNPSQWIYPSPTRVSHVLLFAGVMKVTGATGEQAGAAVSWFLGICSVLVLARLGRRFINGIVGVLAAVLLATYVVDLEFSRRAWGESTASFVALLLVYATLALDRDPRSTRWRLAFFAAGTLCIFSKETNIFAYALCGVWLVARQLFIVHDRRSAALLTFGGVATLCVAFGMLALLAGNASYALEGWRLAFGAGLGSNEWGSLHAAGAWYQFFQLLWVLSPLTLSMAALGAVGVLTPSIASRLFERTEPGARACASLAVLLTLGLVAACAFGPNLQYVRIMAPANGTYCLLAALGVRTLLVYDEGWLLGKVHVLALGALPVVLALAAVRDYSTYRDVVVRSGMQDLAMRWILDGAERRNQPNVDSTRQALEASAPLVPAVTPDDHLGRSVQLCKRGAYAECVAAARAAVQQNPGSAEAWNNAAAGYAGLQLWDEAIRSAHQALKLRPNFPLAQNNLNWSTAQRAQKLAAAGVQVTHGAVPEPRK
jgi:tetratricopeptide (TPR) repeat protein